MSDTQLNERLVYPWKPDDGVSPSDKMRRTLIRSAAKTRQALKSWGIIDWISFFIPCVAWLRTYQWRNWLAVGHNLLRPRPRSLHARFLCSMHSLGCTQRSYPLVVLISCDSLPYRTMLSLASPSASWSSPKAWHTPPPPACPRCSASTGRSCPASSTAASAPRGSWQSAPWPSPRCSLPPTSTASSHAARRSATPTHRAPPS